MQPNAGDDCFDSDKPKQHNWLAFSIVMRENPFPQGRRPAAFATTFSLIPNRAGLTFHELF
jgi:hypothetical protein